MPIHHPKYKNGYTRRFLHEFFCQTFPVCMYPSVKVEIAAKTCVCVRLAMVKHIISPQVNVTYWVLQSQAFAKICVHQLKTSPVSLLSSCPKTHYKDRYVVFNVPTLCSTLTTS